MISFRRSLLLALVALLATPVLAERTTVPTPRNVEYSWMSLADWYRRHADDVEVAAKGEAEIVFVGDSITQGWEWAPSWERAFAQYRPANFGIGGDKTENLLWRLQHGATGALAPKVAVLLIGVNNFGHNNDSAEAVYLGVWANVEQLKRSFPETHILTLAIFPYGELPGTANRDRLERANALIEGLAGDRVTVLNINDVLLEDDGSIAPEVMADFLHPTAQGYERITRAILPTLHRLLER